MKKLIFITAVAASVLSSVSPVHAADDRRLMPIAAALAANDAPSHLGDSVKFYFGQQSVSNIAEELGQDKTSQKTNSFGKSAEQACNWAFLSAMIRLQKRAEQLGADAVVNIVSNYKNVEMSSEQEFECHVGTLMTGVALKGDFVRLKK
jgi:uncharacterized protein YbjQ (UPF0145 family)